MWRPVYRQSTFLVQRFDLVASLAATPKKMQKAGGIFESCPTFKSRRNVPTLHFFHLAMEEKDSIEICTSDRLPSELPLELSQGYKEVLI